MDYNDIIVIMLLIIIIMGLGLILLKKESLQTEYLNSNLQNNLLAHSYSAINNNNTAQKMKNVNFDNNINNGDNNFNNRNIEKEKITNTPTIMYKKIENINNSNRELSINDKLKNIKNNKNKNCVTLKNNKNYAKNNKNNIYIDDNNNIDLQSLDNNSLISFNNLNNNIKQNDVNEKIYDKQGKFNKNEKFNKKVIIDDYSEYDNIKSLNSMDNTLSDLISIVEKDK